MILLLWSALALAAPCALDVPQDAPFEVRAPEDATHVQVLIELWSHAEDGPWVDGMLRVLESRGLHGAVLLPLPEADRTDPQLIALAQRAGAGEHDVGVVFNERQVPLDALASPAPMKRRLRALRKAAGGVKLVATPLPSRSAEALMGRSGFRTILQMRGPATAIPRPAVVFEGQPRIGAVLQAGPYAGPCGVRPEAAPLTPASADRITQAIWGAARIEGVPVVRVAIPAGENLQSDTAVLGRWLDEVLKPVGIRPATPDQARQAALAYFRTGKVMDASRLEAGGGRLVSLDEVRAAADALDNENILPRKLPGELNLTEAFLGFALILTEQNEGEVVRLTALDGPETESHSTLEGIVEMDREALVTVAKQLLAELPGAVPSAMPVGDRTLSASELLTAFAAAIRGTPQTWPTASPEPHAQGQGWGSSTLP